MSAPARLLGLRLHGFKSFAERTEIEFGPGISAVVGPNGSGKSNLADALRWTLGEQGRSLRIRKSEDVIWAGSERRAAQGMADVALVIDNADGLLPVEYGEVELGRRLYRSGENDYLLNRQRVRLRDLVDLLDAAHLADNAFLFIGQGMVDQALALRPEERRPLFEEVAGVRRHERRRRRAEEQLVESESNLGRVEDIAAELRPQVRRLAIQVEQQATRASAGDDLAAALILALHARWHEAAARGRASAEARAVAAADCAAAVEALGVAEDAATTLAAELGRRSAEIADRQLEHDEARTALETVRLRDARLGSEIDALGRDRERLAAEQAAATADALAQRRAIAVPVPARDLPAETALAAAERALSDALAELAAVEAADRADGEQQAALRRAAATRAAEHHAARQRLADAEERARAEGARARQSEERRETLATDLSAVELEVAAAAAAEEAASARRETASTAAEAADAARRAAVEAAASMSEELARTEARHRSLTARIHEEEARGIARAARRHGGRRVDEELVVEPALRSAVERVLGELGRAYVVRRDAVVSLSGERGHLVVAEALERTGESATTAPGAAPMVERASAAGGGLLISAVRRDPGHAAATLLARAVWLPDAEAALDVQPLLPPGWVAVTRDGTLLLTRETVALGAVDAALERRAEADRLHAEIEQLRLRLGEVEAAATAARAEATAATAEHAASVAAERDAREARRAAEDRERALSRDTEAAVRETAWQTAQAERLADEAARAKAALEALGDQSGLEMPATPAGREPDEASASAARGSARAAWRARADELRATRDRLLAAVTAHETTRRSAEEAHVRAQAAGSFADERAAAAGRSLLELATRERRAREELASVRLEVAAGERRAAESRSALEALRVADAADRDRLRAAERAVHGAREVLRSADERQRSAEVADLEARLGLDAIREGAAVELGSLGPLALRALAATDSGPDASDESTDERFRDALAEATARWAAEPPPSEPPGPARLAALRRRYHELGSGNPSAAEEYAEIRDRLESLDGQARDLRDAISGTRRLIDELNVLIAAQFQATFRALETAFDARFRQLFGGGFARLSLTEPDALSATGIEIVARPPGKKPQTLAMLSGGERALTAVALLFAMLEVRPVPFCVLDEVDAALDEANVGRFTDALRSLADRIQFVVITHNRGTIESADSLHGVTVGDDSVSRVISLRLDEAQAIAGRRRAAVAVAG
ncbi:MAG TPA: chromosome segregation protein SMC [Candidatus Limnocylindrales bacterium]|nr:chromosome segregation protein SMC [Candidatus Limnocylindrales bacterium]